MPSLPRGTPVPVLNTLNANREQVNKDGWSHPYEIDKYHNFYIKPRIRIPVGLPDNTEICTIKVYDWKGPNVPNAIPIKDK